MIYFAEDPIVGGATFEGNKITLSDEPGLGITDIKGWEEIYINYLCKVSIGRRV